MIKIPFWGEGTLTLFSRSGSEYLYQFSPLRRFKNLCHKLKTIFKKVLKNILSNDNIVGVMLYIPILSRCLLGKGINILAGIELPIP